MRTNIELDDALVAEARKYSRAKTKRALVEEALSTYVTVRAEERRRETYVERLGRLQVKLSGLRLRDRPVDLLRKDRTR